VTHELPIVLCQLWLYRIKSLGGVAVEAATITAAGSLELDREWVVVDPAGHKLWQGDLPVMALSRLTLTPEAITIAMPGFSPLRLDRNHDGPPVTITQYKHSSAGIDAGDPAAEWLSEAFGRTVRLVRIGPNAHLRPNLNPVHVLSLPSLAALNAALAGRGIAPVEVERFRPNFVLDALDPDLPAYFEEAYDTIRFPTTELRYREPCVRCELPNINRFDANRERQPLKLIGALSRERVTTALAGFGVYARLSGPGEIRVGARGAPGAPRIALAG